MKVLRLKNTGSTNDYLLGTDTQEEVCAVTDYQSAGKGMGNNTWESEAGKNLLFSILVHPTWLPATEQYLMSMAEAIAVCDAINSLFPPKEVVLIKWPNDIYWKDKKLSGTRIDGNIKGGKLADLVIGTGINVNQTVFVSDAPNPVSMKQVTGIAYDCDELLNAVLKNFAKYQKILRDNEKEEIMGMYHERLYRREGFYWYEDKDGAFEAELMGVNSNGIMTLRRKDGTCSEYEFKEVKFVMA